MKERTSAALYTGATIAVVGLGLAIAFRFVEPAPPDQIRIGAGAAGGAYHEAAEAYREVLDLYDISLEVVETAGSVENLERLTGDAAREQAVDVALVQGGVKVPATAPEPPLMSIASVYLEAVWVLTRADMPTKRLSSLVGKRIAVGASGSGTRALSMELLAANGVTALNSQLVEASTADAAVALADGTVDALFIVSGTASPVLRTLAADSRFALMSFERAEAYARNFRFMATTTLPRGAMDLSQDVPPRDLRIVTAAANLVARDELHPTLVALLLIAAQQVHSDGGLLEARGAFPTDAYVDFPLDADAKRFFERGPPFLIRVLPFWAAVLVDRFMILLVPLAALAIPLTRVLPPMYRWRVRSRIYRWYTTLGEIEEEIDTLGDPPHVSADAERLLDALNKMEDEARSIRVPGAYKEEHYQLRMHIDAVRMRLQRIT